MYIRYYYYYYKSKNLYIYYVHILYMRFQKCDLHKWKIKKTYKKSVEKMRKGVGIMHEFKKKRENGKNTNVFIPESVAEAKKKLHVTYISLIIRGIESFYPDKIQLQLDELKEDNEKLRKKLTNYALNVGAIQEQLKVKKWINLLTKF